MRLLPRIAIGPTVTALFIALTCVATRSEGAPPDQHTQEASKRFQQGVELYEDGDWRAALIEFERAYAVAPNFRVLYNIAQCHYQLHDYPAALDAFRKYLADGQALVPPEQRAKTESDIESLKGRVASLRLSASVDGAEVGVDDMVVGTTPIPAPVVVSAGRHKLTASKAGLPGVVRYVDIAGEETLDVPLDLGAPPQVPVRAAPAETRVQVALGSSPRGRSLAPAVVAFGVTAVGVAVGSYFGIEAISNKHDLDQECVLGSCPESSKPLYDEAERNALLSTLGFGAAVAGACVGAMYLMFTGPRESAGPPLSVALPRLVVGPGSIGAEGTF
jgi:hypothetical protein